MDVPPRHAGGQWSERPDDRFMILDWWTVAYRHDEKFLLCHAKGCTSLDPLDLVPRIEPSVVVPVEDANGGISKVPKLGFNDRRAYTHVPHAQKPQDRPLCPALKTQDALERENVVDRPNDRRRTKDSHTCDVDVPSLWMDVNDIVAFITQQAEVRL